MTDAAARYQALDGQAQVSQNLVYNPSSGNWELEQQAMIEAVTANLYLAVDDIEQYILDTLEHYKFYAWEVDTSVYYMGYQDKAGAWYAKKIDPSAGTCLYAVGGSSPPTAANLSAQSYDAFAAKF